ncbi:MAG: TorF family putative porin [Arenimonas sp.]
MTNKLSLALAAALFALPTFAFAQDAETPAAQETMAAEEAPATEKAAATEESESNLSFNAALVSDYVFRGISQTAFDPALQVGVDYSLGDSGFYVGAWGSNVDFGSADGSDFEVDLYVGYNVDLSDDWNLDLNLTRYNYLGSSDGVDDNYNEFITVLGYKEMLTFTLGYTNNYVNADIDQLYFGVDGTWEVGNGFNLTAGLGRTDFEGGFDYTNWTLGVNRDFGPVNIGLNYYDTDISGKVSDQIVLGFSIGG